MHLDNVTIDEARTFLSTRTPEERKFYEIDADREVRTSRFIAGVRSNGVVVGVAGVAVAYHLFPHTYYMVRKENWGNGVGIQLQQKLTGYIQSHKVPFILQTVYIDNVAANKLHDRLGTKVIYKGSDNYHRFRAFTSMGKLVAPFLPLIIWVYYSPIGKAVIKLRDIPKLRM